MPDNGFKTTDDQICVFFMTLLVFLDMGPFFVWSTVTQVGYRIYTAVILVTTLLMFYMVFFRKQVVVGKKLELREKSKISLALFLSAFIVVLLFFYEVYVSGVVTVTQQPFNMAMLCIHIGLMMFVLQDNMSLQTVYCMSKKIFAVSLIPAIIVFLILQIEVVPPHITLSADAGKKMVGQSYELYAGLSTVLYNRGTMLNRLCGMYREPGFVGTMGALYLLGDKMTHRKWENLVIIVAGLFSFSLAFVIILALGILLRAVGNMKRRSSIIASTAMIAAVVIGYFIFMGLPLDSTTEIGELQSRLVITEDGLVGDNRFGTSEWAEEAYDLFMESPLLVRLFGYGKDPSVIPGTNTSIWQTVCSYKEFVFGFGFVGLGIVIACMVLGVCTKFRGITGRARWNVLVLLSVFLISIYQRYSVINFHYYCVLFGGAANLALLGERDNSKSEDDASSLRRRVQVRW